MQNGLVAAFTQLLVAAFVIDRVASAVTFLLSRPSLEASSPESAARQEWHRKLLYSCVASALAAVSMATMVNSAKVLEDFGLKVGGDRALASLVVFILLVGGADRLSALARTPDPSPSREPAPEPLQVQGTLRIEESPAPSVGRRET